LPAGWHSLGPQLPTLARWSSFLPLGILRSPWRDSTNRSVHQKWGLPMQTGPSISRLSHRRARR